MSHHISRVRQFQEKFRWLEEHQSHVPKLIGENLAQNRLELIAEELIELTDAVEKNDMEGITDALVDLSYVILGTANLYGLNLAWNELFEDVHRANMSKQLGIGKRGHSHDVIKPDGWVGPRTVEILRRYGWEN